MGADNDPVAVTDNQGRVRGVAGLRVVDTQSFPACRAPTPFSFPACRAPTPFSDSDDR